MTSRRWARKLYNAGKLRLHRGIDVTRSQWLPGVVHLRFLSPLPGVVSIARYTYHVYLPYIFNSCHFFFYASTYSSSTRNILFIYLFIMSYYIIFYFILTIRRVQTHYTISTICRARCRA